MLPADSNLHYCIPILDIAFLQEKKCLKKEQLGKQYEKA